jgi:hypothetical protein
MPQTLLALVAILVFSFFALSQHGATADVEQFAVTAEVELAAQRLARQRLAEVLARAFDEADVGLDRARVTPDGLSTLGPDDGVLTETTEATYDDVDDFHSAGAQPIVAAWMDESIDYWQTTTVRYIDLATGAPSTTPTLAKEVTVEVRAAPAGFVGAPQIAATLSQIVTPSSQL